MIKKIMKLPYDNIDTDIIIPTQFLKVVSKDGLGKYAFYEWRYNSDGSKRDHITNTNDDKSYNVIISKINFGCGSSREHAAWALSDYGIDIIIAASFSDIFYRNWLNNRKLPIILPLKDINNILESETVDIKLELENAKIIINGKDYEIKISSKDQYKILNNVDDIEYTLNKRDLIEEFEKLNHK